MLIPVFAGNFYRKFVVFPGLHAAGDIENIGETRFRQCFASGNGTRAALTDYNYRVLFVGFQRVKLLVELTQRYVERIFDVAFDIFVRLPDVDDNGLVAIHFGHGNHWRYAFEFAERAFHEILNQQKSHGGKRQYQQIMVGNEFYILVH